LFPVYVRTAGAAPYLYFDSRTYGAVVSGEINHYASPGMSPDNPFGRWGVVRPYLSSTIVSPTEGIVAAPGGGSLAFMNPNTFQIISAGLDNSFGSVIAYPGGPGPVYFAYPTGKAYWIDGSGNAHDQELTPLAKYGETAARDIPNMPPAMQFVTENHHLDNLTNFAEGLLETALP
jgi:hypothetical protein